jgi:hypothetical protein
VIDFRHRSGYHADIHDWRLSARTMAEAAAAAAAMQAGSLGLGLSATGFLLPAYFAGVIQVMKCGEGAAMHQLPAAIMHPSQN